MAEVVYNWGLATVHVPSEVYRCMMQWLAVGEVVAPPTPQPSSRTPRTLSPNLPHISTSSPPPHPNLPHIPTHPIPNTLQEAWLKDTAFHVFLFLFFSFLPQDVIVSDCLSPGHTPVLDDAIMNNHLSPGHAPDPGDSVTTVH